MTDSNKNSNMPFRLGLTGSIATGKTTVLNMLEEMGYPGFSADEEVHQLYRGPAVPLIARFYPPAVIENRIDRQKLARHVLQDPSRLRQLERIVHPLLRQRADTFISKHAGLATPLVVLDIPLLFENEQDWDLDAVAVTWCTSADQRKRALQRPGMTFEKLQAILNRQMPQQQKRNRADYTINTSCPLEDVRQQLHAMLTHISQTRRPSLKLLLPADQN